MAHCPSLIELQIEELLSEVAVDRNQTTSQQIDKWFHEFCEWIKTVPDTKPQDLCSAAEELSKSHVRVPLSDDVFPTKGLFKFHPPTNINLVGSYVYQTNATIPVCVDIQMEMPGPPHGMQDRDYLNQVYHRKRALYLAHVAANLKQWSLTKVGGKIVKQVTYGLFDQRKEKPILIVEPAGSWKVPCRFHLYAVPPEGFWKASRFACNKSNIRSSWFSGNPESSEEHPTPRYNAEILLDISLHRHSQFLKETLMVGTGKGQGVRDGVKLLKMWLKQREGNRNPGRISPFILTMFVADLIRKKRIDGNMLSFQVFRTALVNLAAIEWDNGGLAMEAAITAKEVDSQVRPMQELISIFPVVFMDIDGQLNLTATTSRTAIERIRHEAQLSVAYMDNNMDVFQALFLTSISFNTKFDHIFHIKNCEIPFRALGNKKLDTFMDRNGDFISTVVPDLVERLQEALGKRTQMLDVAFAHIPEWGVNELPPLYSAFLPLTFGVLLDKHFYMQTIERGPEANSLEATKFRQFWGKKAELRRFPDGSMAEAVVWKSATVADKRVICQRIIKHVLQRHLAIDGGCLEYVGNLWQDCLHLQKVELAADWPPYGSGEEYSELISKVYDQLSRDLLGLKNLPLTITSVRSVCPSLRATCPFPPLPATFEKLGKKPSTSGPIQSYVESMPVQLVMESSSRWPDDRQAIRRLKAAFQIHIGGQLKQIGYQVVFVNGDEEMRVWKEGYCFRLEVVYMGEMQLARKIVLPDGRAKLEDTEEFLNLRFKLSLRPKLASALMGLARQNESFGTSCRLAKRWLSCQLLDGYINEETAELLMAHIYIHPSPYSCPISPEVAFVRFLELITIHDWHHNPLIINFNEDFSVEEMEMIRRKFNAERNSNAQKIPSMFIVLPFERTSVWTRENPSAIILKRLVLLANLALKTTDKIRFGQVDLDSKSIFRAAVETNQLKGNGQWDMIVHLRPDKVSRCHQLLDLDATRNGNKKRSLSGPSLKQKKKKKDMVPVLKYHSDSTETSAVDSIILDLDTVEEYVTRLRNVYGDIAYFLCDPSGLFVTVKWKKHAFDDVAFEKKDILHLCGDLASVVNDGKPNAKMVKLGVNHAAVVEDLSIIGRGLVDRVQVCSDNWKV